LVLRRISIWRYLCLPKVRTAEYSFSGMW